MKTKTQEIANKIKTIETIKNEISYFGIKWELKSIIKKAMKNNWKQEDVHLLIDLAMIDATNEAKEDLEREALKEVEAKETVTQD
jgi:hypothetical protein